MARKKGTKNQPLNALHVDTPRCTGCESTQIDIERIICRREIAGVTRTGQKYTCLVWRRVRCKKCGIKFTAITPSFDPDRWNNPNTPHST